jgi:hypothetical protein
MLNYYLEDEEEIIYFDEEFEASNYTSRLPVELWCLSADVSSRDSP